MSRRHFISFFWYSTGWTSKLTAQIWPSCISLQWDWITGITALKIMLKSMFCLSTWTSQQQSIWRTMVGFEKISGKLGIHGNNKSITSPIFLTGWSIFVHCQCYPFISSVQTRTFYKPTFPSLFELFICVSFKKFSNQEMQKGTLPFKGYLNILVS